MLNKDTYEVYLSILEEELIPATGCTEPIALAYCAATARQLLDAVPEKVEVSVSGNILKNVKSVVVPNTNGMRGVRAAVAVGIVAGQADQALQVISHVSDERKLAAARFAERVPIRVECRDTPFVLDMMVTVYAGTHSAAARIVNSHTNIVYLARDGEVLRDCPVAPAAEQQTRDKSVLNVTDIVEFADTVDLERLLPLLRPQVELNSAIAEEGLRGDWGVGVGRRILSGRETPDIQDEARAYAAAGSDARMSGCEMPVVILSGSGNQGIAASMPVLRYGRRVGAPEERIYRALAVSDLVTVHQKAGIGRLSAYCGAVSAGVGAGAGIAYLMGAGAEGVAHTIGNAVAILSGTICDGAKPSCAAKIAMAVDAGILGYQMDRDHKNFEAGDGIVGDNVEATIQNVGVLASQGMRITDQVILEIMTQ